VSIAHVLAIRWMSATQNLDTHLVTQNIRVDLAFPTRVGILAVVAVALSTALQAMEAAQGWVCTSTPHAQFQQLMALLQKTLTGGANTNEISIRANLSHSSPNALSDLFGTSFIFSVNTHLAQLNHTTHPGL